MRNQRAATLLVALFLAVILAAAWVTSLSAWGFSPHREINYRAVAALPDHVQPFFLAHRDYLAEHAVDPDLWRRQDTTEAVCHYIDIDMYGRYPFRELPRSYDEAVARFGEEVVRQRGVAPWRVVEFLQKLTEAMRSQKTADILLTAAALGHYVADLHVPLHTVENYDGQLTGNKGIHKRWESVMIDAFFPDLGLDPPAARYIEDPLAFIFDVVLDSYVYADDLVRADDHARTPGRSYTQPEDFDTRYYAALFRQTRWIAQQRLQSAISNVASAWYTAWRNAGEPVLATD